jgi:hypothetical protein
MSWIRTLGDRTKVHRTPTPDSDSDKSAAAAGTAAAKSDSDSDKEEGNESGGGYEADNDDDHANDNDHSGYDSSFASLDPESTRPATPERTPDLEKMISALTNILTFGSRVAPAG